MSSGPLAHQFPQVLQFLQVLQLLRVYQFLRVLQFQVPRFPQGCQAFLFPHLKITVKRKGKKKISVITTKKVSVTIIHEYPGVWV